MIITFSSLVCGDVCGQFNQLFKRVNSVNQKAGPFELLLCVGDFFDDGDNSQWTPYKTGQLKGSYIVFLTVNSCSSYILL